MEVLFLALVCLAGFATGVYMIISALSGKVSQPKDDWMFSGIIAEVFGGKRKWAILFVGVVWAVVWLLLFVAVLLDSMVSLA